MAERSRMRVRAGRRNLAGLLLCVGLTAATGAAAQGAAGGHRIAQPDASRFPEIRLFAHPSGPGGEILPNLSPRQFRVLEDGKPAAVLSVQGGDRGSAAVCLVLDRSGSMALLGGDGLRKMEAALQAARRFVQILRPADRAALITFAGEVTLEQPLTDSRAALLLKLKQAQPFGSTNLYDAVHHGIDQVALSPQGGTFVSVERGLANARRVVLALTDGLDEGSTVAPARLIRQARANGVSLYTVGFGQDVNRGALTYLAGETGGEYFDAPSAEQLLQVYERIARRLREEYRVAYRSPRPDPDGTRRQVTLTVEGTRLPAARGWYQAPGRGSMVVTIGPAADAGAGMVGGDGRSPGRGVLLAVLGVGAAVAAAWGVAAYGRRRRLPGSPRAARSMETVDYGGLWLDDDLLTVGRDPSNALVIDHPSVSRRHARIEAAGGGFRLLDEGSTNGTWVNGRCIRDATIAPGDRIRFGSAFFEFTGRREPPPEEAAGSEPEEAAESEPEDDAPRDPPGA